MADSGYGAPPPPPPGVPPVPPPPPGVPPLAPPPGGPPYAPPRRKRSGCAIAIVIVLLVFLFCVAAGGLGAWYFWSRASAEECFPAGPDGPLDTSQGPVPCSHPNAIWKVMKVMDGMHNGDVIGTCGPDGDALIYLAEEDKSYCLDYIN